MKTRYSFGAEPPAHVTRVRVGPAPVWFGWFGKSVKHSLSQGMREKRRRRWVMRGQRGVGRHTLWCRDIWTRMTLNNGDQGWFNGDKWRPWGMVENRSEWGYAVDLDAMRRVRWAKRKRRNHHQH